MRTIDNHVTITELSFIMTFIRCKPEIIGRIGFVHRKTFHICGVGNDMKVVVPKMDAAAGKTFLAALNNWSRDSEPKCLICAIRQDGLSLPMDCEDNDQ
jgi:hypothetical protein